MGLFESLLPGNTVGIGPTQKWGAGLRKVGECGTGRSVVFLVCLYSATASSPLCAKATSRDKAAYPSEATVCPPHNGRPRNRSKAREATPDERRAIIAGLQGSPVGNVIARDFAVSMDQARKARSGWTHVRHEYRLGVQVTYAEDDGRISLWMSGVPFVRKYRWVACEDRFESKVSGEAVAVTFGTLCFNYGRMLRDVATGRLSEEWRCASAASLDNITIGKEKGDVFRLSKATAAPFVLSADPVILPELKSRLRGEK